DGGKADAARDGASDPADDAATNGCPVVAPPDPHACDAGGSIPIFGTDSDCIVGYECAGVSCPEPPHQVGECDAGDPVPVLDDAGICWLGIVCMAYCPDAGPLPPCHDPSPVLNDAGTCVVSHECPNEDPGGSKARAPNP